MPTIEFYQIPHLLQIFFLLKQIIIPKLTVSISHSLSMVKDPIHINSNAKFIANSIATSGIRIISKNPCCDSAFGWGSPSPAKLWKHQNLTQLFTSEYKEIMKSVKSGHREITCFNGRAPTYVCKLTHICTPVMLYTYAHRAGQYRLALTQQWGGIQIWQTSRYSPQAASKANHMIS